MDEASGNALDSSWRGKTGTPTGTKVITNCPKSSCRNFVYSSSDRILLPDLGIASSANRTITGWFYLSTTIAFNVVYYPVIFADSSARGVLLVNRFSVLTYQWEASADEYDANNGLTVALNKWYFGAVVITPSAATVWLNNTSWTNTKTHNAYARGVARIGTDLISDHYWSGNLDDVRIYDRALTAQEVKDIYNAGMVLRGTGTTLQGTGTKFNY